MAVTQGQVHVSDWHGLLRAGQQLAAKANAVTPTPRLSYLLDWTRDLMAAAESPLVPASNYSGGASSPSIRTARKRKLTLRKYHVDVHIEDGFARTTIDQTYFNHTASRLEGTFYFPLPPDASLSRLAMYVDGNADGRRHGRARSRPQRLRDHRHAAAATRPCSNGWTAAPSRCASSRWRPRQEKRIILSLHAAAADPLRPARRIASRPGTAWSGRDWSFHARVKGGAALGWQCPTHA